MAQSNIARMRAPLDSPIMREFAEQLEPVNRIADESPGFVWRLQGYEGNATAIHAYDDPLILFNMSVWESLFALHEYTYRSAHAAVFRDRKRWFEQQDGPSYAMWWITAGELPSVEDGKQRLEHLRANGASPYAFDFRNRFDL